MSAHDTATRRQRSSRTLALRAARMHVKILHRSTLRAQRRQDRAYDRLVRLEATR